MGCLSILNIFGAHVVALMGEHEFVITIFVVYRQNGVVIVDGKEAHAVVVVTKLTGLCLSVIIAIAEFGHRAKQGVTPGDQSFCLIAFGHNKGVFGAGGNRLKAHQGAALSSGGDCPGQGRDGKEGGSTQRRGTAQKATAAQAFFYQLSKFGCLFTGVTRHCIFPLLTAC